MRSKQGGILLPAYLILPAVQGWVGRGSKQLGRQPDRPTQAARIAQWPAENARPTGLQYHAGRREVAMADVLWLFDVRLVGWVVTIGSYPTVWQPPQSTLPWRIAITPAA